MEKVQSPYGNFTVYVNYLDYGNFTVYVNYLDLAQDKSFHISFVDSSKKVYVILMKESARQWIVSNEEDLPHWIIELQSQFQMLVQKELLRKQFSAEA
jgi:hypothetical protein